MSKTSAHAPGAPCWFELGTTEQDAAKQFYSSLLGWTVHDSPMGPGESYTTFKLEGDDVAAAYKLGPQMGNVPPHWMVYFATPDVDAAAAKVVELGGTVKMGPFDVMEHGRMGVFADPTGAVFCLWQAKSHCGVTRYDELNAVCWSELATRDAAKARDFYTALLGWKTFPGGHPGYDHILVGGEQRGGILTMDAHWEGIPPHWGIYFMVDNCDAYVEKIKALGGTLRHGPFEAPNVGRIAIAADAQGAGFSIIQLPPRG